MTETTEQTTTIPDRDSLVSELDNARQMVRFHADRAERFKARAEKAESELSRLRNLRATG